MVQGVGCRVWGEGVSGETSDVRCRGSLVLPGFRV